ITMSVYHYYYYLDFLRGDSVNQTAFPIMVKEGQTVQIPCSYKLSSSTSANLLWYRQYASGSMEFVLLKYTSAGQVYETPGALGERFSAEVDSQRFTLSITRVLLSDSLMYYCALRPTVKQTIVH
ncbi:TVA1 protein, partial [Polyodon spathula]|nr:TVA1 protein [Polyodon spathula]